MATGHFEEADYDVIAPKIVTEISHQSLYEQSELIGLFRDFSEALRAGAGKTTVPYIARGQMVTEDLSVVDCDVQNQCQKFDVTNGELTADKVAYLCWELQRRVERFGSQDYKAAILREALSAGAEKFDADLINHIKNSANLNDITPVNPGQVSLADILNARKFIKDTSRLNHGPTQSYIVGRSEIYNQITNLKDFTACCGPVENPVNGLVGNISGFGFIEVSNNALDENEILIVNRASGAYGLLDAEFRPAMRESKKVCYSYEWIQDYGFLLHGDGALVARLQYSF